jgi:SH3-like domain-containing protein
MRHANLLVIPVALLFTACQLAPGVSPSETPSVPPIFNTPTQALPPTETRTPTSMVPPATTTPIPAATLTPSITMTATPFTPFDAVTTAVNVNLRVGPSYLFPALGVLPEGGTVSVLGKAPGEEWFRVRTKEKKEGWVFGMLLRATGNLLEAPILQPNGIQLIKGRVRDTKGVPIKGIAFQVVQETGGVPKTNTVLTDGNGEFFSFMPINVAGTWTVTFTGIACESNVWTDSSCTFAKNGYANKPVPASKEVTLPFTDVLDFLWE